MTQFCYLSIILHWKLFPVVCFYERQEWKWIETRKSWANFNFRRFYVTVSLRRFYVTVSLRL